MACSSGNFFFQCLFDFHFLICVHWTDLVGCLTMMALGAVIQTLSLTLMKSHLNPSDDSAKHPGTANNATDDSPADD